MNLLLMSEETDNRRDLPGIPTTTPAPTSSVGLSALFCVLLLCPVNGQPTHLGARSHSPSPPQHSYDNPFLPPHQYFWFSWKLYQHIKMSLFPPLIKNLTSYSLLAIPFFSFSWSDTCWLQSHALEPAWWSPTAIIHTELVMPDTSGFDIAKSRGESRVFLLDMGDYTLWNTLVSATVFPGLLSISLCLLFLLCWFFLIS